MAKRYAAQVPEGEVSPEAHGPLKVSFAVYVISLLVVALVVFALMLVAYMPGHQKSYRLKQAVKNSDVTLKVEIPEEELASRDYNPTNKKFTDSIAEVFKQMGAKTVVVEIKPLGE